MIQFRPGVLKRRRENLNWAVPGQQLRRRYWRSVLSVTGDHRPPSQMIYGTKFVPRRFPAVTMFTCWYLPIEALLTSVALRTGCEDLR